MLGLRQPLLALSLLPSAAGDARTGTSDLRGVPAWGERNDSKGGPERGVTGTRPGCVLGRLASTAAGKRWGSRSFLQATPCPGATANQQERKEAGGDEESAALRQRGRLGAWSGQGSTGAEKQPQPPPGPVPPSATARPRTPAGAALPLGQRWPRRRRPGSAAEAGMSRQHRAEGPGSQQGLEEIQSKAGGCPKQLSRLCRDTDGLASFVEAGAAPSCSPILSLRLSPPGSSREKTIRRATHFPHDPPGF